MWCVLRKMSFKFSHKISAYLPTKHSPGSNSEKWKQTTMWDKILLFNLSECKLRCAQDWWAYFEDRNLWIRAVCMHTHTHTENAECTHQHTPAIQAGSTTEATIIFFAFFSAHTSVSGCSSWKETHIHDPKNWCVFFKTSSHGDAHSKIAQKYAYEGVKMRWEKSIDIYRLPGARRKRLSHRPSPRSGCVANASVD